LFSGLVVIIEGRPACAIVGGFGVDLRGVAREGEAVFYIW
jgi:hypothetical protein